jgi:hypothetical protein
VPLLASAEQAPHRIEQRGHASSIRPIILREQRPQHHGCVEADRILGWVDRCIVRM